MRFAWTVVLVLGLVGAARPAHAQGASLEVLAVEPAGPRPVGEVITVTVRTVVDGPALGGADFSLSWDPAVLSLSSRQLGDFWGSAPFDVSDWIAASPGWAYFGCVDFEPGFARTSGTWTLVTFTFTVVGEGSTGIAFGPGSLSVPGFVEASTGNEIEGDPRADGVYPAPLPPEPAPEPDPAPDPVEPAPPPVAAAAGSSGGGGGGGGCSAGGGSATLAPLLAVLVVLGLERILRDRGSRAS